MVWTTMSHPAKDYDCQEAGLADKLFWYQVSSSQATDMINCQVKDVVGTDHLL